MTDKTKLDPGWATVDESAGTKTMSGTEKKELKKKNLAVAGALAVFVALVFLVTMAKLSTNFGG